MTPRVGDLVRGKYRIVRVIGDGGMGSVYEARHEGLGSQVALKFLHADLARRPGLAQRFSREARVSAAISSPHVTRVTDVDTTEDGTPFLVMELLTGKSLGVLLDGGPGVRPSHDESIDYALQILAGLEAAHALGVVHRDLKPDNVFITSSAGGPIAKLIDFGIAKVKESGEYKQGLTFAGILMGTPEYMAPEQLFSANAVDHRADLYSLGVMLFEMLAGQRPAQGDTPADIVSQVQNGTAKRLDKMMPDLPSELISVVHTALSADPSERFDSAFAMRVALSRSAGKLSHAGQLAATSTPATTPPRADTPRTDPPPPSAVPKTVPPVARPASAVPAAPHPGSIAPVAPRVPSIVSAPAPELWAQSQASHAPKVPSTAPPVAASPRAGGTVMTPSPAALPVASVTPSLSPVPSPSPAPIGARRVRKSGGALPWILGVVAVGIAGAIGVIAVSQMSEDDSRSATPALPTPLPATPVAAQKEDSTPPSQHAATGDTPPTAAAPTPTQKTPSTSAPRPSTSTQTPGNDSASDPTPAPSSSAPPLTLPFPLPSTLPPLPSSLPPLPQGIPTTLPSSFPTFPGLPTAPPASSTSQPATGSP